MLNHHTPPYTAQSCKTLFSHVYSPSENMHQPVLAHIQLIQNGSYLFSPVYSSFRKTRYYTSVTNDIAHLDWFIPILPHIQLIQKNQLIIVIVKSLQKSKIRQIYYRDPQSAGISVQSPQSTKKQRKRHKLFFLGFKF